MRIYVRLAGLAGVAVLSLTLAACGGGSEQPGSVPGMTHTTPTVSSSATPNGEGSADTEHNQADVSFAQAMIVHHQAAIAMAKLALTRASSAEVKNLARRIEAAQSPEISQMTRWTWNQPMSMGTSMEGMDMGSEMGMMSPTQMNQLAAATGKDFDRMFLQLMTAHHQGAISMAKAEQADGVNSQAIALAKAIQTSQTNEVAQMSQMLDGM